MFDSNILDDPNEYKVVLNVHDMASQRTYDGEMVLRAVQEPVPRLQLSGPLNVNGNSRIIYTAFASFANSQRRSLTEMNSDIGFSWNLDNVPHGVPVSIKGNQILINGADISLFPSTEFDISVSAYNVSTYAWQ